MKDFLKRHGLYLIEVAICTIGLICAQFSDSVLKEFYSIIYCILIIIATALASDNQSGGSCCG